MVNNDVPATLPVYRLAAPRIEAGGAKDLFEIAFGKLGGEVKVVDRGTSIRVSRGSLTLDVDKRSDHIFVADRAKLWNPREFPQLPDETRAWQLAERFGQLQGPYLPAVTAPRAVIRDLAVKFENCHNTATRHASDDGRLQSFPLDQQVIRHAVVELAQSSGAPLRIPVTGGGGKFRVAFGHRESLIGLSGGWRPIVEQIREEAVIPQQKAIDDFKAQFPGEIVRNITVQLAYYAAPAFAAQEILAPVWIVDGNLWRHRRVYEIRSHVLPATSMNPFVLSKPATTGPMRTRGVDALELDCGVEWMGAAGSTFEKNKCSFVAECARQGACLRIDFGNKQALERHFHADDAEFVDAVNLMFFTGHADAAGWIVSKPDRIVASYTPGSGPPVRFGDGKLDWLVIAACGPHQSKHFDKDYGDAFSRWRETFAGLHGMLGFGSLSYGHEGEGGRFVELLGHGEKVVDAWFQTAVEVQPCIKERRNRHGIVATAMFAHDGNYCTSDERLTAPAACPGVGTPEQKLSMIWSGM
jgi:hypothetical protein